MMTEDKAKDTVSAEMGRCPGRLLGAALAVCLLGALFGAAPVQAQTNADYAAGPLGDPISTPPNVLLLMDASGTIKKRAAEEINGGTWTETETYTGVFDPMFCYSYDPADTRFEDKNPKTLIDDLCPSGKWDGNLLNWISLRRYDAITVAMIGGICIGGRNADGTCVPIGSPPERTIAVQKLWGDSANGHVVTPAVNTGAGVGNLAGRMPNGLQGGATSLTFHLRGGDSGMQGSFCTDNDTIQLLDTETSCSTGDQWDDINGDKVQDPGEVTSETSDGYVEQQFFMHAGMDSEPTGVVQEVGSRARFGLALYSSGAHPFMVVPAGSRQTRDYLGTAVETFQSNTVAMIDAIEEAYPTGGTPIRETMYGAMRYFAQVPTTYSKGFHTVAFSPAQPFSATGTGSLGPGEINVLTGSETCPAGYLTNACGRDPNFFGSDHTPPWANPSGQATCCKNYVVLFWDGIPSGGGSPLPASLVDYGHSVHGSHGTIDDKVYDIVGTAYWAHIKDLRQATIPVILEAGHDLSGVQNVTTYALLAFGDAVGRAGMQEVAKYGGFEDSNGNDQPDLVSEWDAEINATGAAGSDGIPDTFFESNNANEIKDKLSAALTSILKRGLSGTAASVVANSSSGDGSLYQSYYYRSTNEGPAWIGYTQALFLDTFGNLREDTNGDGKLIYKDDYIIETRLDSDTSDVVADRFTDSADGNGVKDSSTPTSTVPLKDVKGIWEGGKRLAQTASSARTLLTWVDKDDDGVVDSGEQIAFDNGDGGTDNTTALTPYLNPGAAPFTATNIINFIRGQAVAGMRDRTMPAGVWKLGDTIHAQPIVVGPPAQRFDLVYGDSSYTKFFNDYRNRRQVVYMGANDGMLHAFNGGYYHRGDDPGGATEHGCFNDTLITGCSSSAPTTLGNELWGFIPQELLPHLKWLTDPGYTHVYYVDLTPKVVDARIFCDGAGGQPSPCITGQASTSHPNGWGTILMGGFRLGGSCGLCTAGSGGQPMTATGDFDEDPVTGDKTRTFYSAYFVLDVTNPEEDPKLLWSFSDANLGFTTTVPSMLRVSPAGSGMTANDASWYMVVGSGPTGYDGSVAQSGRLYAINLAVGPETGGAKNNDKVETFVAEALSAFMGSPLTVDPNFNYRVDTAYMGSVIDDGTPPWRGKLYRLTMNACGAAPCSAGTWGISGGGVTRVPTELLDTFPSSGSLELGPVTAAPGATIDDSNKLWVFAGTGRLFDSADEANTDQQYFVGVKDSVMNAGCTQSTTTNCHDDDLVSMSTAKVCVIGVGDCGQSGGTEQVTGVTGLTNQTFDGLVTYVQSKDGWYTTLPDSGERVLSRPTVFGGVVFFPSFLPGGGGDPCAGRGLGTSYIYALYYKTGSAYSSPIVGVTNDGTNDYVDRRTSAGEGEASEVVVHLGKGSIDGQAGLITQGGGILTRTQGGSAGEVIGSRFKAWWKQSY